MSDTRTAPQGNGAERQQVAVVAQSNPAHGLVPQNFDQAIRFAELMARSKMVPKHFQGKPEECLVIIEQAMRWEMSPYAVIQCASMIYDRPMYEGKLVAAVVNSRGPRFGLQDRLRYRYEGQGPTRKIIVSGVLGRREEAIEVVWKDAKTSNEQWTKQPDQQLAYHGARVWARRHMPELMLGVYSAEEFDSNGGPVDDFTGETIEGQRELPPVVTDQPIAGGQSTPNGSEKPRRTFASLLDEIEADAKAALTEEDIDQLERRDDRVLFCQEKGSDAVKGRLARIFTEERERIQAFQAPPADPLDELLPEELQNPPADQAEQEAATLLAAYRSAPTQQALDSMKNSMRADVTTKMLTNKGDGATLKRLDDAYEARAAELRGKPETPGE